MDGRVSGNQVAPFESGRWAATYPWSLVEGAGIGGGVCIRADAVPDTQIMMPWLPTIWGRTFPVPPSRRVRMSAWVRTTLDWNGKAGENSKLRLSNAVGDGLIWAVGPAAASGDWTLITATAQIPLGVTDLRLQVRKDQTVGTIWWDRIEVRAA